MKAQKEIRKLQSKIMRVYKSFKKYNKYLNLTFHNTGIFHTQFAQA